MEDKIPRSSSRGDFPLSAAPSCGTNHLRKAQLMDPAGVPIHGRIKDEPLPEPVPRPPVTAPSTFAPLPYQK